MALNDPDIASGKTGITPDMIRKWKVLQTISEKDETLYYYIIVNNIKKMSPIIYTPTVGWVCKNFSNILRKPKGLYITSKDKGIVMNILDNCGKKEVDAIVITDGSRILGLGDLGVGGLGISIGKLDLYVAAGGFDPSRVLPIVLDVGTNNESLLADPNY